MKKGLRIASVATGHFDKNDHIIPGVITSIKSPNTILNVNKVLFKKDGNDATEKIIEVILKNNLPHDIFILKGITIAGLNYIDPFRLIETFHKPIVIVFLKKKKVDLRSITSKVFHGRRINEILERLPPSFKHKTRYGEIYISSINFSDAFTKGLINKLSIVSKWPEPLRITKIIANSCNH